MSDQAKTLSKQIATAMVPLASVSSRWPSVRKLGEELQKRLQSLQALSCVSALSDIETWLLRVPLEAAESELVATGLVAAFKVVSAAGSGIVKSGADVGTVVHDNFAAAVARDFVKENADKILIAENDAYVPPFSIARPLDAVKTILENTEKDYSLTVLSQARGSAASAYIRGRDSTTSREDLVVFRAENPLVIFTGLGLTGRPEVYEVKAIDSLVSAVPQVTAYSWNYLVASVGLRCTRIPTIPGAYVSNTVMLPADPESKSISLPVLSFVELSSIGSLPLAPTASGPVVASFISQLITKAVQAGPYIAIPFMVSGLYGVIPYFLLDVKKLGQALQAVLQAIVAALMLAWLGYQANKGFKRPSLEAIVVGLVLFVLLVAIIIAIIATLPESLLVIGALAAVVLVIIVVSKSSSGAPSGSDNLNIHLGTLHAFGLTANQFASWMADAVNLFADIWNVNPNVTTVDVTPPG